MFSSLLSGTLDPSFANWTSLTAFALFNTRLSGTLSASFTAWSQLAVLALYGCARPRNRVRLEPSPPITLCPAPAQHAALWHAKPELHRVLGPDVPAGAVRVRSPASAQLRHRKSESGSDARAGRSTHLSGTLEPSVAQWASLQQLGLFR
jgi:hypothetical protein